MTPAEHARIVLNQIRVLATDGPAPVYRGDCGAAITDIYADMPWSQPAWDEAAKILLEHPDFTTLNRIIFDRFGEDIEADLRGQLS